MESQRGDVVDEIRGGGSGELRSRGWFAAPGRLGSHHRSKLYSEGLDSSTFDGRPIVGICNTASELNPCNLHLTQLAEHVRRGVIAAGGAPFVFPTMSLGEPLIRPTAMLLRNLMAMDVEESIRGNPLDAVVLLGGCDKTTPALVMGAASADLPCIVLTSGPMMPGCFEGRPAGSGTDLWKVAEEVRAGNRPATDLESAERALSRSNGHCNTMGTASTMACLVEALGLSLPGSAAVGAVEAERARLAWQSGRRAVEIAVEGLRPSQILTDDAFRNAIVALSALSGSTNAIIHLLAIAGRVGIDLELSDFDRIAAEVPVLVDVKPAGQYLMDDFAQSGGMPALLNRLRPWLSLDALTVTGHTLEENCADASVWGHDVIRSPEAPLAPAGSGLAILYGNLAPRGAVMKPALISETLAEHRGRAVVFDSIEEYLLASDDPDADFAPNDVLVVRNAGPVGYPGMPEIGNLPLPRRCLEAGVRDMVRVTDARMSGTAYGTVILHVCPESSIGGPLAALRTGDTIVFSLSGRRIDVEMAEADWEERLAAVENGNSSLGDGDGGYLGLYRATVLQADRGADLDFLVGRRGAPVPRRSM